MQAEIKERLYPGYGDYDSPDYEVGRGQIVEAQSITTPADAPKTTLWPRPHGRASSSAGNRVRNTTTATTETSPTSGNW